MQIELTQDQIKSILARAENKVMDEACALLRAEVQSNLKQWAAEVKNQARGAVADAVSAEVMKRLDVSGCVDKAMENINKRIHTDLTRRLANGINVTFQATVANPVE